MGAVPVFLVSLLLAGCAAQGPLAGAVQFAALGDVPYSAEQVRRLDRLIDDLNADPLAFVVHVGDIGTTTQACADTWLEARKRQFGRIRHPFVLVPGDNEWSDCAKLGLDPVERLGAWRSMFCMESHSLKTERQPGPHCEHLRWQIGDTLFVTLNVPGGDNNLGHPEHATRMRAVLDWIDAAERLRPTRLVLLMQANPFLPGRGYEALNERLAALGARLPGRVTLVHGDTHVYKHDEPLAGLRRVELWGAPFVGWTRFTLGAEALGVEASPLY